MSNEVDVGGPGKFLRILRATDKKALLRTLPRRMNEIRFQAILPIRRIRTEIGEIGSIVRLRRLWLVQLRIDMAIEGCGDSRTKPGAQLGQRRAACVAQHQIKVA